MNQILQSGRDTKTRKWGAYSERTPSSVTWIQDIPSHWKLSYLKAFLERNDSGIWGDDAPLDGTIVLRSTDVDVSGEWRVSEPARRAIREDEARSAKLQEGDLVVTKSSGSPLHLGKTAIVTSEVASLGCCFSNFMQRLRCQGHIDPRFVYRILNSEFGRQQMIYLGSTTTGLANLNGKILGAIAIPVPPLDEMKAICDFLDRQTAKIDALIEKKKRLIELLAEKRTALITQAVTKGLDPTVPMKDSGIRSVGVIPVGWDLVKLKFLTKEPLKYGANESGLDERPEQARFIRITDVTEDGQLRTGGFRSLSDEAARDFLLSDGDILFARSGATVGKTLFYRPEWGPACFAGYFVRARLNPRRALADYLRQFVQSSTYWNAIRTSTIRATIENVSAEKYGELVVPVPPLPEQIAIVKFLDEEVGKIERLAEKVNEAINCLKEYRSAVISAAVTGKIDVRGETA